MEPEAIWIIGTTHVSKESASDVERVIRAVNPENVVVELCRSRQVLCLRLRVASFNSAIFPCIESVCMLIIEICFEVSSSEKKINQRSLCAVGNEATSIRISLL